MPPRIAIIGAGIAGLAAGHRIRQRDPRADLTIFEAGDRLGGVLRSEIQSGYLCEHAANGFLAGAQPGAAALCRELGIEVVTAAPTARRRWIFRRGALRQVPMSPPALLATDLLSWRGRLRMLVEPFARKPPAREETIAEFGRRRLGVEATEALVAPFVLGVWAGDAERLSLRAAFPRIAALEAAHGGLLRGMLATERAGGKAPVLSAPRAGMEAIPVALGRALSSAVRLDSWVEQLDRQDGEWRLRLRGGAVFPADRVVLAVPPAAAAGLIEPHGAPLAESLRASEVVAAMVVHVGFPAAAISHRLDGFGFLVAEREAPRCLGCVFESSVWPERAPAGHVLLRLIYGGARDPGAIDLDDAAVGAMVKADLGVALGISVPPDFLRIVRWPRAIPQYGLGHLERVAELERRARTLGLVLAGSGYHGVSINDLVDDAERVAGDTLTS